MESLMIKPQLCKAIPVETIRKAHNNYWQDYVAELKIDGWRGIVQKDANEIRLFSRTGKEYTQHAPGFLTYLDEHIPNDTILDGEIVFIKDKLLQVIDGVVIPNMDFSTTAKIMGSGYKVAQQKQINMFGYGHLVFMPFDVLRINGQDLTGNDYLSRSSDLRQMGICNGQTVVQVPSWNPYHTSYSSLFKSVSRAGLEGLVLKHTKMPYVEGSRKNQLKVKAERYFDVIVYGFEPGKGKYEGTVGALKFAVFEDGNLKPIGQCSGMDDETRDIWYNWLSDYKGLEWPVIEIKCNELTVHGVPRHPQYIRSRPDKDMTECTAEQFV